ncbi:hypothetical protein ACQKMZ_25820 [Bacillus paramycoides]
MEKTTLSKKYNKLPIWTAHFVEVNDLSGSERGTGGLGLTEIK